MEITNQARLSFSGVDILEVKFSAKKPFVGNDEINVSCTPYALLPKEQANTFHIIMDVEVSCESYFELSLKAVGLFKLSEDINETLKKQFVNINAVAIMFPYVRAFVSTFSSNTGSITGSLTLPTQFFRGNLEIIDENEIEEQEEL